MKKELPQNQPKEEEKRNKERIQLDFSHEALERLDEIKRLSGSSTRAETIRQALRLYEWFIKETEPESVIIILDEQGNVTTRFKAMLLHNSDHGMKKNDTSAHVSTRSTS